ncbi:hypothetical protein CRN84_16185 [Budvicia aquatica]|uniref:Uncharacterized protein n=1 Tax=Budvicia aquatica TaxID=82979 RepID=A0A2C6DQQ4_9GAMM|nr:hypothetical protein CRN84_16185 [Budvicia aquatica]
MRYQAISELRVVAWMVKGTRSLSNFSDGLSLIKSAVFTKKYRLTEIMRPCANDNREVDDFAIRLGAIGQLRP